MKPGMSWSGLTASPIMRCTGKQGRGHLCGLYWLTGMESIVIVVFLLNVLAEECRSGQGLATFGNRAGERTHLAGTSFHPVIATKAACVVQWC